MTIFHSTSADTFLNAGFPHADYFPHEAVILRKQQPDFLRHLKWRRFSLRGLRLGNFRQLNLYARRRGSGESSDLAKARPGIDQSAAIANAGFYTDDVGRVFVGNIRPNPGRGIPEAWYKILLNAMLSYASIENAVFAYCPTSTLILAQAPGEITSVAARKIYDWPASQYSCGVAEVEGLPYWRIPLALNRARIARLDSMNAEIARPGKPVVCVFHDIEGDVDTPVSKEQCQLALNRMLAIEQAANVNTTYNILGTLYKEKEPVITASGAHSIAFHSYDHQIQALNQLARVRAISAHVRGYRPPQSHITRELTDYALSFYNFEWLMSSAASLSRNSFGVEHGIVKIPVHFDDYPLYRGQVKLESWVGRILQHIERNPFTALGLHDCYADCWIESYPLLIERLKQAGSLWTADQICKFAYLEDSPPRECGERAALGETSGLGFDRMSPHELALSWPVNEGRNRPQLFFGIPASHWETTSKSYKGELA